MRTIKGWLCRFRSSKWVTAVIVLGALLALFLIVMAIIYLPANLADFDGRPRDTETFASGV